MSSQETPYQRLRRKIEALIRHSRGTDNEDEARIFAQKAAELMEKCAQLGYEPGEDKPTNASRPEAGSESLDVKVHDIGSTRQSYVCLFGSVCDYFHCHVVFFTDSKYRKAEVYGSKGNLAKALAMYDFWKKQCIALGKVANEEDDLSAAVRGCRFFGRRQTEDHVFGAFTRLIERAITNPENIRNGRALTPPLVENKKSGDGAIYPLHVGRGASLNAHVFSQEEVRDIIPPAGKREYMPAENSSFWVTYQWTPYALEMVKKHMSLDANPLEAWEAPKAEGPVMIDPTRKTKKQRGQEEKKEKERQAWKDKRDRKRKNRRKKDSDKPKLLT